MESVVPILRGCLAVDYVGRRLRTGEATSRDYFTLVELGVDGRCLIREHPVTWVLYNKLVDLLRTRRPLGCGNYLPALDTARDMLLLNKKGSCLLQLVFLTDGAPSDHAPPGAGYPLVQYHVHAVRNRVASIARKFGSRLTFGAIFWATLGGMMLLKQWSARQKIIIAMRITSFHPSNQMICLMLSCPCQLCCRQQS